MKYIIRDIRIPIEEYNGDVLQYLINNLILDKNKIQNYSIIKESIDARKSYKDEIYFVFTMELDYHTHIKKDKYAKINISKLEEDISISYHKETKKLFHPPIIVGFGPSGIFAALRLAERGLNPIVIERGQDIQSRKKDVETFWKKGILNINSNVQFGEGGAGTFSDGKLTTRIKEPISKEVIEYLIDEGAPEEIRRYNKPHIGTDKLEKIVVNIRRRIEKLGGQILFNSCMTDIIIEEDKVRGIIVNNIETLRSDHIILAIGHSARDTYKTIIEKNINIETKALAIGVRIEHKQDMINENQYGGYKNNPYLKPAEYQLTYKDPQTGRGVYSFCMCPGGVVVAAASEENHIVTNGMSYYARDSENANSAIVSTIYPKDFNYDPIEGINFLRKYEALAFKLGGHNYCAPIQLVGDFIRGTNSTSIGSIKPTYTPGYTFANMGECLPESVSLSIKNALEYFDGKINGFACDDAILTGVETRTSSPMRILRNKCYQSTNVEGLYPVGEGAGYAGGIMSASVDGLKVAEEILKSI